MKKKFVYPKRKIIFPYIFFLLPSVLSLLGLYELSRKYPRTIKEDWLTDASLILFSLGIAVPVILWMINKIKTEIEVDERGIVYKSLFKNIAIKWHEILGIQELYLYERRYQSQSIVHIHPESILAYILSRFNSYDKVLRKYHNPPRDLIIKTKNRGKITISHFVTLAGDVQNGLEVLESEIQRFTNMTINTVDNRIKINKKAWKIILIALSCFIAIVSAISAFFKKETTAILLLCFGFLMVIGTFLWLKNLPED